MSFDNQKDEQDIGITNSSLKKGLVEAFGNIPVSSQDTALFIRATAGSDEAERITTGGYGFDKLGFVGNGVSLGNNEQDNLKNIDQTHRDSMVVEFFAFPNIRRNVVNTVQAAGINHREIPIETLFTDLYIPNQGETVGQSGMMGNTNEGLLIPNIFFKGYFDKKDNSWHPNSTYWETNLEPQAREDVRKIIVAKAMNRLNEVIEQKKKDTESVMNFFSNHQ